MKPEELREFFISKGLTPKMSSFISPSGNTKYKLGKNSLKRFIKGTDGWIKIRSMYYKDISINPETGKLHITKFI
jgi:hypothetical protein